MASRRRRTPATMDDIVRSLFRFLLRIWNTGNAMARWLVAAWFAAPILMILIATFVSAKTSFIWIPLASLVVLVGLFFLIDLGPRVTSETRGEPIIGLYIATRPAVKVAIVGIPFLVAFYTAIVPLSAWRGLVPVTMVSLCIVAAFSGVKGGAADLARFVAGTAFILFTFLFFAAAGKAVAVEKIDNAKEAVAEWSQERKEEKERKLAEVEARLKKLAEENKLPKSVHGPKGVHPTFALTKTGVMRFHAPVVFKDHMACDWEDGSLCGEGKSPHGDTIAYDARGGMWQNLSRTGKMSGVWEDLTKHWMIYSPKEREGYIIHSNECGH